MNRATRTILSTAAGLTLCASSLALSGPVPPAVVAAAPAGKPGVTPKQDFPPFEEAMKEFKEVPSRAGEGCYLSLFHNEKEDELRAVIPSSMIGSSKPFLVAVTMSGGPFATGFQLDHFLAYFEKQGKQLILMRVDARYAEAKGQTVADVVARSYRDDILRTIPIVTMRGGDPVVSLDAMFKGDFAGMGKMMGGGINPSLSKWTGFKPFPENVELTVDTAFMERGGEGQRIPMHYSISAIPQSSYTPRVADPRVGYFTTARMDWGKKHSEKTLFDRYIHRWNLQKRDPSLDKSPPKDPIVWYIEKDVPVPFRHAVKEGIAEWNKAFEKCGFQDAIVVLQQEDKNEYSKFDPEDCRYNFFRWIVTGEGFAMGPSRANPLTGEIFDADIVFDDSMVRHYVTEHERMTGAPEAYEMSNPFLDDFFRTHPQWAFHSSRQSLMPGVKMRDDPRAAFFAKLTRQLADRGQVMCDYEAGMARQMSLAEAAFAAKGKGELPAGFLNQIVKEIVMHEVGHCLGLRHNFKGSTWLDMEQIANSDGEGTANIGSVMDYNPPIMPMRGGEQSSYTTRSIGPYDCWAIEYGYRPVGKPYADEAALLKGVAGRAAEDGLAYATDEDTFSVLSPDPLVNRFDCGKNVVDFAKRQLKLTSDLLTDVAKWGVKDGESYSRLRRTFRRLALERGRVNFYVARFVGGEMLNRDCKGDKNARPAIQPVTAARQREAVKFVCDNLFAKGLYNYSPALLNSLAPGRNWHWDSDDFDFMVEFDVHGMVSSMQWFPLFTLMNPFCIDRLHDNEVKMPDGKAYTLAEHMTTLQHSIWSELNKKPEEASDEKPYVDSFRRNLQRMLLGMMLNYVLEEPGESVPADCNSIARLLLSELSEKIGTLAKEEKIDTATLAHLKDSKAQIDRALKAQFMAGGGMGGGMRLFMREAPPTGEETLVLPKR